MKIMNNGFPDYSEDFETTTAFYCDYFEKKLTEYINLCYKNDNSYSELTKAYEYSLRAGGKRIRPILVFEFCRVCNGNINDAVAPAIAIEMIHTFSLIHDDLPAMDNDDIRRGMPSCHKAFGEANALLAGDALTVKAFQVIAESKLEKNKISDMISVLCRCSYNMIGGQIIDIRGNINDFDTLTEMYSYKTSQLIIAASLMGCYCNTVNEKMLINAENYAYNLGIAFQIIDDILDVTADETTLGKPVGSDCEQNKDTSVTLLGLDKARLMAAEYTKKAIDSLGAFDNNKYLLALTDYLLGRKK